MLCLVRFKREQGASEQENKDRPAGAARGGPPFQREAGTGGNSRCCGAMRAAEARKQQRNRAVAF